MTSTPIGQIAATFGTISLLAIGGANAVLPEIHRQVVGVLHWTDDATFAKIVAIAQTAPGPNLLIVSLIGWQIAGLAGLLVATAAITAPSTALAVVAGRLLTRWAAHGAVALLRQALAPVAVGLLVAGGLVIARAADQTILLAVVTGSSATLLVATRVNPIWNIVGGAIAGAIIHTVL